MEYILKIGVGLAIIAIAGICKWFFSRKKPKSSSQTTNIKGNNNKVTNTIVNKDTNE